MLHTRLAANTWSCCTARASAPQWYLPDVWKTTQWRVWLCHRIKTAETVLINKRSIYSDHHNFAEGWIFILTFSSFTFCSCTKQNPNLERDSRECMILSISTSTRSKTAHYHRDFTQAVTNIQTTLELRCGSVVYVAATFCQRCVHVRTVWD